MMTRTKNGVLFRPISSGLLALAGCSAIVWSAAAMSLGAPDLPQQFHPGIVAQSPTTNGNQPATSRVSVLRPTLDPLAEPERKAPKPRHLSILMVGDTGFAPHRAAPRPKGVAKHGSWLTWQQTTRHIAPMIDGDLNFANVETVISDDTRLRPFPKRFNFISHPEGMRHLVKTGFNLFSLANNHSFDYGAAGIRETLLHSEAYRRDGLLAYAGTGMTNAEAAHTPVVQKKGIKVAFAAIGIGASAGGIQRATAKRPGQLNLRSPVDRKRLFDNLKQADADFRILSVHNGPERIIRPSGHEVAFTRRDLLKAGKVDLLIGHHAHVTRGLEMNNGRLIVYGLGNFLHQGTANMARHGGCRNYSIIVKVHLAGQGEERPQIAAIEVFPITATHIQPRRLNARQSARRIGIINGLAAQFDDPGQGARGVRFTTRRDGSGLFCTAAAKAHPATAGLCEGWKPVARNVSFRRTLATCGAVLPKLESSQPLNAAVEAPSAAAPRSRSRGAPRYTRVPGTRDVVVVHGHETYAQKRVRWRKKLYTAEEVAAWKRHVARKRAKRNRNR